MVGGQFGVESGSELVSLSDGDDMTVHLRKNLHFGGEGTMNVWCADEGHRQLVGDASYFTCCLETAQLPTVCITANVNVHRAESFTGMPIFLFGKQDQSCTSAKDGQAFENGLADRVEESQTVEQVDLGGRFATRDDERILRLLPVLQLAYLEGLHAQLLQHLFVFDECPLQGQYCNSHTTYLITYLFQPSTILFPVR